MKITVNQPPYISPSAVVATDVPPAPSRLRRNACHNELVDCAGATTSRWCIALGNICGLAAELHKSESRGRRCVKAPLAPSRMPPHHGLENSQRD